MTSPTIAEAYNFEDVNKYCVGIEVEVESDRRMVPPAKVSKDWTITNDSSLKAEYPYEFITKMGLTRKGSEEAIDNLADYFRADKGRFEAIDTNSPRSSIHVHINVRHLNQRQLLTGCMFYWLLESLINRWHEEHRRGWLFCMPIVKAEDIIACVSDAASKGDMYLLTKDRVKYGSLNLATVSEIGTAEFRVMAGSDYDKEKIKLWVKTCSQIMNKTHRFFSSPKAVYEALVSEGVDAPLIREAMYKVMPSDFVDELCKVADQDLEQLISENAAVLLKLASVPWDKVKDPPVRRKEKKIEVTLVDTGGLPDEEVVQGYATGQFELPTWARTAPEDVQRQVRRALNPARPTRRRRAND